MSILKLCNSVVADHNSNLEQFASLEEEYGQQADLTSAFYDRLIEIIEEMKADHLSDLMQERDKYTQIAEIENDNIR
jgi:Mg/Co/Ni transporter MgtE